MYVTGVSSSTDLHQIGPQQGIQQRQNDFQGLAQSLKSGDLSGAQNAFAALQQDLQKIQSVQQSNQTTGSTNSLGNDIQGLAQSLTSGDLSGAQKAFATLAQALQTAGVGHHHHHHHQGVAPTQAAATYSNGSNTTSGTGVPSVGSGINVSA